MARGRSRLPAFVLVTMPLWAAPATSWSQSAAVAPGETVRLQAPDRIVIPGVLTLEGGLLEAHNPYDDENGVVVVRDGDRTLHVPRPGERLTGQLVGVTDDFVTLREGKDRTILVPRQAVQRLEVRRGGHPARGALVGATAAFALGFAIGYVAEQDCTGWVCSPELAGAGLGLLLTIPGAGAGAAVAGGRWEPVSMENLRVGVALRRDGATAGVTFGF